MRILVATCCLILLIATTSIAKIVFEQTTNAVSSIYVMEDDGTAATLLTDTLNPIVPKWSPDGKSIAFARGRHIQSRNISIMNADGTEIRDITVPVRDSRSEWHPSFSPDGKSIVFSRHEPIADKDKRDSVMVMNLESGKLKKIADLGINTPEFSPDGNHIVFTTISTLGVAGGNVWIMEDDGADPRPLLPPPPDNNRIISRWTPRWSPNGKQILYTEDHHTLAVLNDATHYIPQGYYFFICDRNGKNIQKLRIPNTLRANGHDWMDDGKAIVFCAREAVLKEPPLIENFKQVKIYKYQIASGKLTTLYVPQGNDNAYNLDWISDDVLSVSAVGKKKVTWGALKQ